METESDMFVFFFFLSFVPYLLRIAKSNVYTELHVLGIKFRIHGWDNNAIGNIVPHPLDLGTQFGLSKGERVELGNKILVRLEL